MPYSEYWLALFIAFAPAIVVYVLMIIERIKH